MDLYGDRLALKDQITLIKKGLLISGSFWITLQQGQTHFAKYFDSSAFGIMCAQLVSTAHSTGDYLGRNNYAKVLLNILCAQRSLINEKISCLEINGIGRRKHTAPFVPPNAVANQMTADIIKMVDH